VDVASAEEEGCTMTDALSDDALREIEAQALASGKMLHTQSVQERELSSLFWRYARRNVLALVAEVRRLRASSAGVRSAAIESCMRVAEARVNELEDAMRTARRGQMEYLTPRFEEAQIIHQRMDALRALAPGGGGVWVPSEPTEAMLDTMHRTVRIECDPAHETASILNDREVWAAMLKATPAGGA
jgi:hypothetical protein